MTYNRRTDWTLIERNAMSSDAVHRLDMTEGCEKHRLAIFREAPKGFSARFVNHLGRTVEHWPARWK